MKTSNQTRPYWGWRIFRPLAWLFMAVFILPWFAPLWAAGRALHELFASFRYEIQIFVDFYCGPFDRRFWTQPPRARKTASERKREAVQRMMNRTQTAKTP